MSWLTSPTYAVGSYKYNEFIFKSSYPIFKFLNSVHIKTNLSVDADNIH